MSAHDANESVGSNPPPSAEGDGERGSSSDAMPRADDATDSIAGERVVPSITRVRSMQSRVTTMLAIGFMSVMALGLLGWYYSKAFTRVSRDQSQAQATAERRAKGESSLPPLGAISQPRVVSANAPEDEESTMKRLMGQPPELPPQYRDLHAVGDPRYSAQYGPPPAAPRPKSPAELALERKLAGVVSSTSPASVSRAPMAESAPYIRENRSSDSTRPSIPNLAGLLGPQQPAPAAPPAESLTARLQPTSTPAALAQVLPTQRLLLPKGAFIDCTLETALTSALPGMPTCITATDTWSADGSVILLERGTKLIGESVGQAQRGSPRIFVLWVQARTPTGVVVPLASPGTDELGRAGLPGSVNRHFFERFGAAILISVIDGAIQAAANRDGGGNTVILNPTSSQDIITEVLRSTVNIPPTVEKPQGDRIQVLVARDLDFRGVYELRPVAAGR